MTTDEFFEGYPKLYHMAEDGSWPSILEHGLLSSEALIEKWGVEEPLKTQLLVNHRSLTVSIDHPRYGKATLRDQLAMSDAGLRKALKGCTPSEWYAYLNGRVFLWATEERLHRMLCGRQYKGRSHTVLTIDTQRLVELYRGEMRLCHINSGCTKPNPQPRSLGTFRSISDFPFAERRRRYGKPNALAEVTINRGIPDVLGVASQVDRRLQTEVIDVLWRNNT